MMPNPHWTGLEKLILVAGHAVYIADNFDDPENDNSWCLQSFQKGEPPFYIEHIRKGVDVAGQDQMSLLVFSGGQTRYEAGPRSEAQSYWAIADHFDWWGKADVKLKATTEEFAKDSYENLLFGICRFFEAVGRYPKKIEVVSWAFKGERFELHRQAIGFPSIGFSINGINNPVDLEGAKRGERKAVADFRLDPYGVGESSKDKRNARNPFNRRHPYEVSCELLRDLLSYSGTVQFQGPLPWG